MEGKGMVKAPWLALPFPWVCEFGSGGPREGVCV